MSEKDYFAPLYGGFISGLRARFPEVPVRKSYPDSGRIEKVPLFLVECTDFYMPSEQPNDGSSEFETRWEVRHFLSKKQSRDAEFAARNVAIKVISLFRNKVFANWAYPVKAQGAFDDRIDTHMPYESWVSEFSIKIRAEENMLDQVFFDQSPQLGEEHHG